MVPRVVFLDFGGTLASTWASDGHHSSVFWREALRGHGTAPDLATIRAAIEETGRELDGRIYAYLGRTSQFWNEYDERILDRLGVRADRAEIAREVDRSIQRASRGTLYPDTMPALRALRDRGVPLGVISNHNDALRDILSFHGLDRYLSTVTYSQEAGAEKPDRRVFDLALSRAGVAPSEALHIGDSYEADVVGATRAGMRGIWLNRRGAVSPGPCESGTDLLGVVAAVLSAGPRSPPP
jgi:putative hydrolase of the HAD superfamily